MDDKAKVDVMNRLVPTLDEQKQIEATNLKRDGFKADAGKNRLSLIPPEVIWELGKLFTMGAAKYSPDNWKLGMDYRRVIDALMRHFNSWQRGEELDQVDGQHHLDSVIWCAMVLRYYCLYPEKYQQFDDRFGEPTRAEERGQK